MASKLHTVTSALALALLSTFAIAKAAHAAIRTENVEYQSGDVVLKGVLAYDDASKDRRPGVIVVHEWWGLNDYARSRAEMLAKEGYVALAIDMYGDGKSTTHPQTAGEWSGVLAQNHDIAKARFQAGYDVLAKQPLVAPGQIAAIGYCFGGSTVLGMAMAGADLKGVVSFHGALPQQPASAPIRAKILVCHGAADGFISADQVATFQKNLGAANADFQFVSYSGAKHSFTNPGADKAGIDGLAYNAAADHRSWAAMKSFFAEIFGR